MLKYFGAGIKKKAASFPSLEILEAVQLVSSKNFLIKFYFEVTFNIDCFDWKILYPVSFF